MDNSPEPSFEILHLVSTLTIRLNLIFKKCKLDVEQLYILAYIRSHGRERQGQKVVLRGAITKVLKEVFKCSDNQVSIWVIDLLTADLLGEIPLRKEEKIALFSTRKGKNKAIFIRKKGQAKLSLFVAELVKFRQEIISQTPKLLYPPETEAHGPIASTLIYYLSQFEKSDV